VKEVVPVTAAVEVQEASSAARRRRLARLERPLLVAGLALITVHLVLVSLAGPDTTVAGVLALVALPAAWLAVQRHVTRATRVALALAFGLLAFGFGTVSHGLHAVTSGPDWTDIGGGGLIAGGLFLLASGAAALASRRRVPRGRSAVRRAAHAVAWLAGALLVAQLVVLPAGIGLKVTHAPRWPINESVLAIPHERVAIRAPGATLAAWWVPSRNGAAVLLVHGSGGSRARVAAHARMLARHGYGVLALDLPGNGESSGRSNGLGYNAQPAIGAALDRLERMRGLDPRRIAGFGTSLGGEVLLEAAARDARLRTVVSDGAARPQDARRATDPSALERAVEWVGLQAARAISGTRPAPSLLGLMPRIAPRPVLLIAAGGVATEIPTNRAYRDAGGPTVRLWELPEAGHTAGLRTRPAAYERTTTDFLDGALDAGR
jgi:pimeloyl-ACP methyl ester carboxylesterase